MDQHTGRAQEILIKTSEDMGNKINEHIDNCFNQNLENPEGFANCMIPRISKFEEVGKKFELYNLFGQKFTEYASKSGQNKNETNDKLSNVMVEAIERLARKLD